MAQNYGLPDELLPVAIPSRLGEASAVDPPPRQTARMRRHARRDALANLNPEGQSKKSSRLKSLREIACRLTWLHAIGLKTLQDNPIETEYSTYDEEFNFILPEIVFELAQRTEDLFRPRMRSRISKHINKMALRDVMDVITDDRPNSFYAPIMNILADLNMDIKSSRLQLGSLLGTVDELLVSIRLAARQSYLNKSELDPLEKKMDNLDAQYRRAYAVLHSGREPKEPLVNLKSEEWWSVSSATCCISYINLQIGSPTRIRIPKNMIVPLRALTLRFIQQQAQAQGPVLTF
ncbi:hypothetical protein FALCPG4_013817 [Fusarium falciforme]